MLVLYVFDLITFSMSPFINALLAFKAISSFARLVTDPPHPHTPKKNQRFSRDGFELNRSRAPNFGSKAFFSMTCFKKGLLPSVRTDGGLAVPS